MAGRLRRALAALRGQSLPQPVTGGSFLIGMPGPFDTRPIKTKAAQSDAYMGWVYAACSLIAADIRSVEWWLVDSQEKEIERPEVSGILRKPSAWQTWGDLIEVTQLNIDLTGEAFWWLVGENAFGTIKAIQHLPSHWISHAVIRGGVFVAWHVQIPGMPPMELSPRDMIWIRNAHPAEPWKAMSPVEAFALSYNLDLYARAYGAALMKNWAQPPGILSSDQELTSEDSELLRARWKEQRQSAENIAVLGKGAKYQPLSISIKDLAFLDLAQMTRDQILAIYRVPAGKLGLAQEGGTAAEHAARDNSYAKNCIVPRLEKIEEAINEYLLPRILKPVDIGRVEFEFENPVRKDEQFELQKADQGLAKGVIRINQYLEETGRDPLPGPEGDLFMLPSGVTLVAKLEDGLTTRTIPQAPLEEDTDPGTPPDGPDPDDGDSSADGSVRGATPTGRGFLPSGLLTKLTTKDLELAEGRYLGRQGPSESFLRRKVRKLFIKEESAILSALEAGYLKGAQRIIVPGVDSMFDIDLDAKTRDVIDDILKGITSQWERTMREAIRRGLEDGWSLLSSDAARTLIDFSVFEPQAESIARSLSSQKITNITKTTRKAVREVIANSVAEGASIPETAEAISDLYEGFKAVRAETIARTETAYAINRGRSEHADLAEARLGVRIYDTWLVVSDDRTREHHAAANGQRIRHGEYFSVDNADGVEEHLLYPGDGDNGASADNVINCFPAETLVSGPFVAGLTAEYAGELIELHTLGGSRLRVTPNHPIATAEGFVAAKQLRKGDYVIREAGNIARDRVAVGSAADQNQQAPARIDDVFRALLVPGVLNVRDARTVDLDGDGLFVQGKIDVVSAAGGLLCDPVSSSSKLGRDGVFEQPAARQVSLMRPRSPDGLGSPYDTPSRGGVRRRALASARIDRHRRPLHTFRIGSAADLNVPLSERAGNSMSSDADFIRELFHRYAGAVSLDQIIEVRKLDFRGHIFDLQSRTGWMVAQNILCSNCRCTVASDVEEA